jgi:hypothetical protein
LPGILIGVGITWSAILHHKPFFAVIGWVPAAVGAAYLIFYRMGFAGNSGAAESSSPSISLAPPNHTPE